MLYLCANEPIQRLVLALCGPLKQMHRPRLLTFAPGLSPLHARTRPRHLHIFIYSRAANRNRVRRQTEKEIDTYVMWKCNFCYRTGSISIRSHLHLWWTAWCDISLFLLLLCLLSSPLFNSEPKYWLLSFYFRRVIKSEGHSLINAHMHTCKTLLCVCLTRSPLRPSYFPGRTPPTRLKSTKISHLTPPMSRDKGEWARTLWLSGCETSRQRFCNASSQNLLLGTICNNNYMRLSAALAQYYKKCAVSYKHN